MPHSLSVKIGHTGWVSIRESIKGLINIRDWSFFNANDTTTNPSNPWGLAVPAELVGGELAEEDVVELDHLLICVTLMCQIINLLMYWCVKVKVNAKVNDEVVVEGNE